MSLYAALALLLFCFSGILAQNYGDLRLLQGETADSTFTAGRLEIYINSTWGSICADNFDMDEANVACRQLGYQGAISTETSFHTPYGRGTEGPIWLDEVGCEDESIQHILSCANIGIGEHDCDHFSDVAVTCIDQPRSVDPESLDVRLTGGVYASDGVIEVYCNGWRSVCNQQMWFGEREASTVCRQLGYTEATGFDVEMGIPIENLQNPWQGQLNCPTDATTSIASCGNCTAPIVIDTVGLECNRVTVQCAHTIPYGSIRLAQGTEAVPDALEGRLEIFRNGRWGTVCSNTFNLIAANISCKELGFLRAQGFENSTSAGYGEGAGPVHLSRFQCTEADQVLNDCSEITSEECTHEQDVGITCTNDPIPFLPTATSPTEDEGPNISKITLIGLMVGCSLVLILFCICCAVCSLHFYLVPYDTKKERHSLYFIEREGSVTGSVLEAEATLEQKLAELDGDPFEDMNERGKFVPRSRPNRYVSLDTSHPVEFVASQPSSSSVPQPAAAHATPQPHGSSRSSESPTLRRVSVHSLPLTGSPQISKHHRAPSKSSLSSLHSHGGTFTFTTPSQSQGSLNSPIPTSIPIPPPLKHQMENKQTSTESFQMPTAPLDMGLSNSSHISESDPILDSHREDQHERQGDRSPLSTAQSASTSQIHSTPTKSIIKNSPSLKKKEATKPHQSMPQLEAGGREMPVDNTSGACDQTQPDSSPEEKQAHPHHVSFMLD